jgi:C1A family cysteine protease
MSQEVGARKGTTVEGRAILKSGKWLLISAGRAALGEWGGSAARCVGVISLLGFLLATQFIPSGMGVHAAVLQVAPAQAPAPTVAPQLASTWFPQYPLHQGLHLLAGTRRSDYGALPPRTIGNDRTVFPTRVDLSRYAPPVGDQGWVSDCVAWAAVYTLAGWYINKEHLPTDYLSPMFTYSQVINHKGKASDTGAWDSEILSTTQHGMLPLGSYPQGNYAWGATPTPSQVAAASHWTVTGITYYPSQPPQVGDPRTFHTNANYARSIVETALAAGHPALLGIGVYPNLDNATPATAWIAPTPADPTRLLGYHELVIMGYDNAGAWVQNSWGTSWGLNGLAEICWPYLEANVTDIVTLDGLRVAGPALTSAHGAPKVSSTILHNGVPKHHSSTLANGEEVVWSATGFRPNEVVSLFWDGAYRGYVTALRDGTWSLEWYDHKADPIGAHNLHPAPGTHTLQAQGSGGSHVTVTLATA